MSDPICANCGKAKAAHKRVNYANDPLYGADVRVCPTSTFQPKPEPLKAKPGQLYRLGVDGPDAIGRTDGRLQLLNSPHARTHVSLDSADWQEVTE